MSAAPWLASIAGVSILLSYVVSAVRYMNPFGKVGRAHRGVCRKIDGLIGPEDLAFRRDGSLVVSCDGRSEDVLAAPNGAIILLSLDAPERRIVLWDGRGNTFHPHGLDYFIDPGTDEEYLFVIDHRGTHDAVMIFRFDENALAPVREVIVSGTTTLNDLTAVSKAQFYVTQDHGSTSPLLNTISDYLRLPTGSVLYFDGERLSRAASGICYANGIALDHARRRLYVASMLRGKIIEFAWTPATGQVRRRGELHVSGSPDNITITSDGCLVVAVHPKILELARQRRQREIHAPSRILHLSRAPDSAAWSWEVLYADPGENQSAASVAVKAGKWLIVGSVYDDHVVVCDLAA